MSCSATLTAFYRIFQGNLSFFVRHEAPFSEKEGKLKAAWCGFAAYGTKSFPRVPEGYEKGDLVPVTKELYEEHLKGGSGLAVAPLCNTKEKKNVCYFAAIDIDVYGVNFTWLIRRLYTAGFKFAPFLSKSGGLHIYFFFNDAEPGEAAVKALNRVIEVYGLKRLFVNEKQKSKVEVFPKQSTFVSGDKNVNCLFLPFYNSVTKGGCKNRLISIEGKLIGIEKAIPIIESMFTSVSEINDVLDELPYNDAPYCIQSILLTGALAENDFRNNFLFSSAIYLKKKYKEDFYNSLEEMNNCLEMPLEEEEIILIYRSATDEKKNYDRYSCTKSPCSDYCDKSACKTRKFGLGRDKGNTSTGVDCWGEITRYDAGGGKEPSYTWEVRVEEGGEFKEIQIDNHKDLLDQRAIKQACARDLNWVPLRVKEDVWRDIILKGLVGVEERTIKVAASADTTETGALREAFIRFLTHKQIQKNGQPYMVKTGQVFYEDGEYYFDTKGLMDHLQMERHTLRGINLNKWLQDNQNCQEDAELTYTTLKGEKKVIRCWKKTETSELKELNVFYDDVYDGNEDILGKNILDKEGKENGESYGNDTKF